MIVDTGLELVPHEIISHPSVIKSARRRRKNPDSILLDISLHYFAMKNLKDFDKRGRPDIVHFSLLLLLDSVLNRSIDIRIYIYTVNKKIIVVDQRTRLPKNYNRFIGLMEQLLIYGKVPPDSDSPLLEVLDSTLDNFIEEKGFSNIYLLDEKGKTISPKNFAMKILTEKNPLIMFGGFQKGDFSFEVRKVAKYRYSLYSKSLQTWIIVCKLLSGLEEALGIW